MVMLIFVAMVGILPWWDGRAALKAREDAMAELGRIAARQLGWKETANKLRLGAHADLTRYAAGNDLGRDFADAFFPAPDTRAGKKDDSEQTPPAAGGDK